MTELNRFRKEPVFVFCREKYRINPQLDSAISAETNFAAEDRVFEDGPKPKSI